MRWPRFLFTDVSFYVQTRQSHEVPGVFSGIDSSGCVGEALSEWDEFVDLSQTGICGGGVAGWGGSSSSEDPSTTEAVGRGFMLQPLESWDISIFWFSNLKCYFETQVCQFSGEVIPEFLLRDAAESPQLLTCWHLSHGVTIFEGRKSSRLN